MIDLYIIETFYLCHIIVNIALKREMRMTVSPPAIGHPRKY